MEEISKCANHQTLSAVQAMRKLNEKSASVRVRQVDLLLVKEVVEPARKAYTAMFGTEAPALTVDQTTFLPPPPTDGDEVESWWVWAATPV